MKENCNCLPTQHSTMTWLEKLLPSLCDFQVMDFLRISAQSQSSRCVQSNLSTIAISNRSKEKHIFFHKKSWVCALTECQEPIIGLLAFDPQFGPPSKRPWMMLYEDVSNKRRQFIFSTVENWPSLKIHCPGRIDYTKLHCPLIWRSTSHFLQTCREACSSATYLVDD